MFTPVSICTKERTKELTGIFFLVWWFWKGSNELPFVRSLWGQCYTTTKCTRGTKRFKSGRTCLTHVWLSGCGRQRQPLRKNKEKKLNTIIVVERRITIQDITTCSPGLKHFDFYLFESFESPLRRRRFPGLRNETRWGEIAFASDQQERLRYYCFSRDTSSDTTHFNRRMLRVMMINIVKCGGRGRLYITLGQTLPEC